jgi:PII-like signaling protein
MTSSRSDEPSGVRPDVIDHNAILMRIYVAETARSGGRQSYRVLVEKLFEHGFSGATVFRGAEGFGASGRISADWIPDVPGDLPMLVEVATADVDRVRKFLAVLESAQTECLVTLERIARLVCRTAKD